MRREREREDRLGLFAKSKRGKLGMDEGDIKTECIHIPRPGKRIRSNWQGGKPRINEAMTQ